MKINTDPYRDVQEEAPAAHCEHCKQEIYPNDRRYLWEGRWVCEDCLRSAVERELRERPEQVALELGLDIERY